ncbi:Hypothetical protein PBC10988_25350 [Planctomycetales bacterium 10988]|nr:Hypothetical protein PBC10988_25350 [Planctomycetales bacterium 10988]
MSLQPVYPKELTEAAWKSNVSTAYKMAKGKAGISEALRQCEKAFKSIDWALTDAKMQCKDCMYSPDFDEKKIAALKYHSGVIQKKLVKAIKDVQIAAEKAIQICKGSKLIPKSTTAYLTKVKKEAIDFEETCGGTLVRQISEWYNEVKKRQLKNIGMAAQKLINYATNFETNLNKMLKAVEKENEEKAKISHFTSFRTEHIRGIGTALPFFRKDNDFKPALSFWKTASSDGYNPKESNEIDGKARQMTIEVKKLLQIMKSKQLI